jgi:hypothetical protein
VEGGSGDGIPKKYLLQIEILRKCPLLRTRPDLTVFGKDLTEKEMDSTGFEPVAFTLQT